MTAKLVLLPGIVLEYVGDCNISPRPVLSVASPVLVGFGARLYEPLAP